MACVVSCRGQELALCSQDPLQVRTMPRHWLQLPGQHHAVRAQHRQHGPCVHLLCGLLLAPSQSHAEAAVAAQAGLQNGKPLRQNAGENMQTNCKIVEMCLVRIL